MRPVTFSILVFLPFLAATIPARGDEIRIRNSEELTRALREAQPRTTILVAAGTYRGGLTRNKLTGTKDAPIVIARADAANPPVIEGGIS